jgi:hypothetical protein
VTPGGRRVRAPLAHHPPVPKTITRFTAALWRIPGKGGWTFVTVPENCAPPARHAWGRTPVVATVDGGRWKTSTWHEKSGRTLLAVPKSVRGTKADGDTVRVELEFTL